MEGGEDWWHQITEAIDRVEHLVLIVTPKALERKIVQDEWRYARQQGRAVTPILGEPGLAFEDLPRWIGKKALVEWWDDEAWRKLVHRLESEPSVPRVRNMAPRPPQDFVERPEEFGQLIAALVQTDQAEPVAITAALRGAGGYGKTTLAQAICHDDRIREEFFDGVLWVVLGETPSDLTAKAIDLIEVLSGERPGFTGLTAASSRLDELLSDRHLLMVIDDVWRRGDAEQFLEGGRETCAHLMTTRNRDTLPASTATFDLDAMKTDEALRLLRSGLPDGDDVSFSGLVERLGEWPLLLKLANGAIRKRVQAHQSLPDALAWIGKALERRGLSAFDARDSDQRNDAVHRTLGISLEQLSDDERVRFSELAVFPEDVDVPLATVERLWSRTGGLDDFDTESLAERLFDLSLLLQLDLAGRTLRLHDVIRHLLMREHPDLPSLHRELVEAYRESCGGRWSEVEDDGYVLGHLIEHLIAAGEGGEARGLMFDLRWLRRKLEALGVNAVLEDGGRFEDDEEVRLLTRGFGQLGHVVSRDLRQLEGQILGRFRASDGPSLASLIETARAEASRPALLPLRPNLTPAGAALLRTLEAGSGANAVAVTPDGQRAISGSYDNTLKLWDLTRGEVLATFTAEGTIQSCAITPDGRTVVAGDALGRVHFLEIAL